MTCPKCGGRTGVLSTVKDCESVYRRRQCKECGKLIYTEESEIDDELELWYCKKALSERTTKRGK